jgi:hypothetical protein
MILFDNDSWLAPSDARIPDFIICGAMKSGTTTLHSSLNQHPDVFIPKEEVHFFDIDNILQHPDFNFFDGKNWIYQKIDINPSRYWKWYMSKVCPSTQERILGEDSTTYLSSETAIKRIAAQRKPIKLIIMLRHPTHRAYSQYWHMLRTGRAIYSFENTVLYEPHSVLERSMYLSQLRYIMSCIPREQVKVIALENFLMNREEILRQTCDFLEIDYASLPKYSSEVHSNSSRIPCFYHLQIMKNRCFRHCGNIYYRSYLPFTPSGKSDSRYLKFNFIEKVHRVVNPLVSASPPKIKPSTRMFLDDFFKEHLRGLDELVEQELFSLWFK